MDKTFHMNNRRRIAAQMAAGDSMLFFSGEGVRKSADENYPFFTNRNFLYLTGVQ
jgi:Xaa-Pro aminopeptidase